MRVPGEGSVVEKVVCRSHYKVFGSAPRVAPCGLVQRKDGIAPPPQRDRDARVALALRSRRGRSRFRPASRLRRRRRLHDRIAE